MMVCSFSCMVFMIDDLLHYSKLLKTHVVYIFIFVDIARYFSL